MFFQAPTGGFGYRSATERLKIQTIEPQQRQLTVQFSKMVGPPNFKGPYSGHQIHIPKARPLYRFAATGLSASMWFWIMYRAKKDGAVLLGWKHPWDH